MVGILTFHYVLNYGAVLQAYALQRFLFQNQIENRLIDYRCPVLEETHRISFELKNPFAYWFKKRTQQQFFRFVDEKLEKSSCCQTKAEILKEAYSYFLTGSDQVWNPLLTGGDNTYFLSFVPDMEKKYSYAASMGSYQMEKEDWVQKYIRQFAGISLREETTAAAVRECGGTGKVLVHVDPVLLLGAEEWKKLARPRRAGNYILLYMVGYQEETMRAAQQLAKRTGHPVLWLSDSLRKKRGVCQERCCSPEEFLGLYQNASYVVTNSFHGTLFSIIFEKNFYTTVQRGGTSNIRVCQALKLFGLEQCVIEQADREEEIDWAEVQAITVRQRERSRQYLRRLGEVS